ncbi:MAG: amino acid adenylation domain-containing protein [Herminiimonas sp.]|uniref:amino acid adenylation domain-containing protein n=1 Tax=Herminiimonas sp. TaxID=1926289 RepID=UPI00271CA1AC|nr:amino acid adenylation domain-containing protein [Herminiimonas sp.]MDO9419806.1 amino acid adenylation domain-containing protein [Herminiimonas sp.]
MQHYNLSLYFSEVVTQYAAQPALRYAEHEYSYTQLATLVDSLAQFLLDQGLCHGDIVAIANNKRPLSYALMLAAIKLGIAYVNLDVESPLARNSRILKVSGTALLFYDDQRYAEKIQKLAAENNCRAIALEFEMLSKASESDLEKQKSIMTRVDGASIAYVMFTSGSTGTPKGVAVTHQNVLHFIAWGQKYFNVGVQDNFANLSPMYFDNSVFDFYVGLFSGASLTPIYRELMSSPYELTAYVEKMQCSIWFSVPSLLIYLMAMKAFTPAVLPSLRYIVFGGEGYPKIELKKLYSLFSAQSKVTNVYGPTECTCICSAYNLSEKDFKEIDGLPPLGKLNPNFDYRILNEEEKDSDVGELCLIGPNVASGYFNDLERSAASFLTLHEPDRFMKRMYKTGDLVREIDGELYFIGRKDNQIKHMGYRIELEEIEHALVKLSHISQAAVIYQRTNTAYGKLIGFVASTMVLDEKSLLTDLAKLLPEYMLPSQILILQELPKNPNGKVDRQQLLAHTQKQA